MKAWAEFWGLVFSVAFLAGILGNLVANIIWAFPAFMQLHKKLNRHHAVVKEVHAKLHEE